jgi:hypothetical protein
MPVSLDVSELRPCLFASGNGSRENCWLSCMHTFSTYTCENSNQKLKSSKTNSLSDSQSINTFLIPVPVQR